MKHIITLEVWKPVVGFEGLYEVNQFGEIRSLLGTKTKGKLLKQQERNGYLRVGLRKDNETHWRSVNRIVAEAFIPNPDNLPEVDHINNDKKDNRVCNLQWISRIDNVQKSNGIQVQCVETQQIFKCIAEAYRFLNLKRNNGIKNACQNQNLTYHNYHWKFI